MKTEVAIRLSCPLTGGCSLLMAHPRPRPTMVSFRVSPLGLPVLLMLVAQPWWLTSWLLASLWSLPSRTSCLPGLVLVNELLSLSHPKNQLSFLHFQAELTQAPEANQWGGAGTASAGSSQGPHSCPTQLDLWAPEFLPHGSPGSQTCLVNLANPCPIWPRSKPLYFQIPYVTLL